MNLKKVGLVAPVLALLASVPALAQTATTNVSVTASIANTCTITNTAVALGVYDPVVTNAATPLDGSGSVTITCTRGAVTSISLGLGTHATGTQRRMSDGVPDFMNYELYQPPSTTPATACSYAGPTVWGTAGANLFVPAAAPSTAARSYNICGRIAGGQDLPSGSYTDLVVATVNF
jgi:spore coat protein U-like protein